VPRVGPASPGPLQSGTVRDHETGRDRPDDPIIARRRRIARGADAAQRAGYLAFGAAMVLFVVGFATDFPRWLVNTVVALLVVGSILLAPAIVLGYAVRAADREDRERGLG
jgi:hypothetical protein